MYSKRAIKKTFKALGLDICAVALETGVPCTECAAMLRAILRSRDLWVQMHQTGGPGDTTLDVEVVGDGVSGNQEIVYAQSADEALQAENRATLGAAIRALRHTKQGRQLPNYYEVVRPLPVATLPTKNNEDDRQHSREVKDG